MNSLMHYCCQIISALEEIAEEKGFVYTRYTISPGRNSLALDYWYFTSNKSLAEFGVLRVGNREIFGRDKDLMEKICMITWRNKEICDMIDEPDDSEKDFESVSDF